MRRNTIPFEIAESVVILNPEVFFWKIRNEKTFTNWKQLACSAWRRDIIMPCNNTVNLFRVWFCREILMLSIVGGDI